MTGLAERIPPKAGVQGCRLKIGASHVLLSSDCSARSAMEEFIGDPSGVMRKSMICKHGSRGHAVMAQLAGRPCFVKHYRCLGPGYRVLNAFRQSRAVRTWSVSWQLLALGINVPKPLFCVEERIFRFLGESYLATEFVTDAVDLLVYWKQADEPGRQAVLQLCAEKIGSMHALGWCHGDLKWRNLMIRTGGSLDIVFVDIDAAHRCRIARARQARSDLDRFLRDLEQYGACNLTVQDFQVAWRNFSGIR